MPTLAQCREANARRIAAIEAKAKAAAATNNSQGKK
jgi:hypothetical protein